MADVLLNFGGGSRQSHRSVDSRPQIDLATLDQRVQHLQLNAVEKSSFLHYSSGMRSYVQFCERFQLPLDPTPSTLARFIAYTSLTISSGPKYLSGVRHFLHPSYPDFDSNRSHPLVQATIRGAKKSRADPVHRKLPLLPVHLKNFHSIAISSRSYDDLLFITTLSCCFYGCHRSGELVQKNDHRLFDWRKIIKRASLHFIGNRAGYHLPYHKSDPFYRGSDVLLLPQAVVDPVTLLRLYVQRRDSIHGVHPALFLRENGTHPTRNWFDKKFHTVLGRDYGGHSPRAGGATFYAKLGVAEDIIMALGRWSSQAWRIYVREHPSLRAEFELSRLRSSYRQS